MDERELVIAKISRCNKVLNEIKTSEAWRIILEDFAQTKQTIDDNWHLVADPKKLEEMRVSKLAIASILNTALTYEHDLRIAEEQLYAIDNPDKVQTTDYAEN